MSIIGYNYEECNSFASIKIINFTLKIIRNTLTHILNWVHVSNGLINWVDSLGFLVTSEVSFFLIYIKAYQYCSLCHCYNGYSFILLVSLLHTCTNTHTRTCTHTHTPETQKANPGLPSGPHCDKEAWTLWLNMENYLPLY
jgi:hypothetical protein